MHALDACLNGNGKYAGLLWSLPDVLKVGRRGSMLHSGQGV